MRLTRDGRRKGLTLVPSLPRQRHVVGIAESVARAVTLGPGVLPVGIADAVLRLAFGRGAGLAPVVDGADGEPAAEDENGHLLDFLRARAARIPVTGQPRDGDGD
ncbi:MAG: hypothetical protein ACJ79K_00055 [Gemmatimonadaceae bacterium]